MILKIDTLSFSYEKQLVLDDISLELNPSLISLLGINGAGKSTLIKCIGGILGYKGNILFDGITISGSKRMGFIENMSYLPQTIEVSSHLTVFETVMLGLVHSLSIAVADKQLQQVINILHEFNIAHLSKRSLNELSGGQRQVVYLAQALIKEPQVLLLDEPLAGLDIHHQLEVLEIIRELTVKRNMITLLAMHDLNLASRYSDRMIVIHNGAVHADGHPSCIVTNEMISSVYQVRAEISIHENIPFVRPVGLL